MASTFGGLNTAFTGLTAARSGIDVAGQNIANTKTAGYTRQRVNLEAAQGLSPTGRVRTNLATVGQGVSVTNIARLGDAFLDARVRTSFGAAGYSGVRASELTTLEKGLNEPGENGLSAQLADFWSSWQDLSNNAGKPASGAVVIEEAGVLVSQIASGYTAVANQWGALRSKTDAQAADLNFAAEQVAALNVQIRDALASGGSVNELLDQRSQYTTAIASLAGGTVTELPGGMVEVLVGGNPLVSGEDFNAVKVVGSYSIEGGPVTLEWAKHPGRTLALTSGELAGALSMLAPANATRTGGSLAEAAAAYNTMAEELAAQVNAVHRTGASATGATNLDFFAIAAGPAALGLSVIPTTTDGIATGAVGSGSLDGSIADKIAQLRLGTNSPDSVWATFVTTVAVATKSELKQSALADLNANGALAAQLSHSSVDLDEENVNLLMSQTAYQASARVFTAVDEMLDTLINRTGLVGR